MNGTELWYLVGVLIVDPGAGPDSATKPSASQSLVARDRVLRA